MKFPLAAIDLGTNTARLLISHVDDAGRVAPVVYLRRITRLGGGFTKDRGISADACERTMAALRDFADALRQHHVTGVKAVATSAVRDAANSEEFCAKVLEETGIKLEVIDGETEGLLTLRGVLAEIDNKSADFLVFDVGGGSTEYTLARDGRVLFTESRPLGVVRLSEGKSGRQAMEEKILRELLPVREQMADKGFFPFNGNTVLVGTAGTATSLATISLKMTDYDYRLVNNYVIGIDEIREILTTLLPLTPEQRLAVPGLEKGREDLIIAGILIILNTMETFGFDKLKVSDFGLLEGTLLAVRE